MGIGARVEKRLDGTCATVAHRGVEWRGAVLVDRVRIHPELDQITIVSFCATGVPALQARDPVGRVMQRHRAPAIDRPYRGAGVHQAPCDVGVECSRGNVEGIRRGTRGAGSLRGSTRAVFPCGTRGDIREWKLRALREEPRDERPIAACDRPANAIRDASSSTASSYRRCGSREAGRGRADVHVSLVPS